MVKTVEMSNAQVGQVYQQIIQDVIEASRVDFEEGGIDEGVLDELRQVSHPFQIPSIIDFIHPSIDATTQAPSDCSNLPIISSYYVHCSLSCWKLPVGVRC